MTNAPHIGHALRLFLPLLAAATPVTLAAAPPAEPDERIEAVVVYGDDPCPAGTNGEIVVCARKPESERYRIPKELRSGQKVVTIGSPGWASQVQSLEAAGRVLLPNSCSPVGANGFGGCSLAMLHQWYLERQLDGNAPPAR